MNDVSWLTPRLRLRPWAAGDLDAFAAMNADPEVMKFFPALGTRDGAARTIALWQQDLAERGYGNWALALRDTGEFIGFAGLTVPRRALPFMPCVEIGWRLARAHWGRGYATEAAREALRIGFDHVGLAEIVSFTSLLNLPSRRVMERIGMRDSGEDFDHPALPPGHALERHCLYRIARPGAPSTHGGTA